MTPARFRLTALIVPACLSAFAGCSFVPDQPSQIVASLEHWLYVTDGRRSVQFASPGQVSFADAGQLELESVR